MGFDPQLCSLALDITRRPSQKLSVEALSLFLFICASLPLFICASGAF